MFVAHELGGDAEARDYARRVLAEHVSAVEVRIRRDDCMVARIAEMAAHPAAAS